MLGPKEDQIVGQKKIISSQNFVPLYVHN